MSSSDGVEALFGRAAPTYDEVEPRMFRHFGSALVDATGVEGGDLLDVASGKGAVALRAAPRARRVVAVDLAPPMVDELRRRAPENLEASVGHAEALELPDESFDAVFCAFGIFFFPHPERALAEFRRVLRPEGVTALSVFGRGDPRWDVLRAAMRRPESGKRPMAEPDEVRRGLVDAGFVDVRLEESVLDASYTDAEHWLRWAYTNGLRGFFERLSPSEIERWKDETFPQLEAAREPDGLLHNRITAVFVLGRKP